MLYDTFYLSSEIIIQYERLLFTILWECNSESQKCLSSLLIWRDKDFMSQNKTATKFCILTIINAKAYFVSAS